MKKLIVFLLCLVLLTGCAAEAPVESKTQAALPETQTTESQTEATVNTEDALMAHEPEVVDLSAIQGEEVYHVLNDMLREPDEHIGKIVVAHGAFTVFRIEGNPDIFPAVIIDDGDGCNADAIEFILEGFPPYPESYPQEGDIITVVGNLDTYQYEGVTRCHLVNAVIR